MDPSYKDFTFSEGTFEFKGRDAIIAALLRKIDPTLPIATFSRECMQATCEQLESTPLPQLQPIPDAALRDGEEKEYGRKKPDSHFRSKRAADQIAANYPDFLNTVKEKWAAAFKDRSGMANTLAGNRTESHVT